MTPPSQPSTSAQPSTARTTSFVDALRKRWQTSGSLVCVGLDPELERIPQVARGGRTGLLSLSADDQGNDVEGALIEFTQAIVDATAEVVCAFKPNSAFFEQYGPAGMRALQRLITYIRGRYPDIPVILDAKRSDIGSTSAAYARAAFDAMQADAVTLHPYLGREAIDPFLERADRGALILCRTSNPGAGELQDLTTTDASGTARPLYQHVAHAVATTWNTRGNCGLVVGATYPEELRAVREIVSDMPILVPGIGAQGGDLAGVVQHGRDSSGDGLIISLSRSVLYASNGADFAEAGRREAERVMNAINDLRK
ncbi:MAG TPA: orotidine-5'-phosphate decarboxylase [Ktedonobacterales bacterium]